MQQYKQLVQTILEKGTRKGPAREGMPGSLSYFGYQFRHNLAEGFPLLTTKKVNFKKIVVELLWFLRGDTNIKYLNDNGCDIWNEDAYNYYVKVLERQGMYPVRFEDFIDAVMTGKTLEDMRSVHGDIPTNYELGDCGMQYGKLWRQWDNYIVKPGLVRRPDGLYNENYWDKGMSIDQVKNVLDSLKNNPEGRRHIITAWNPSTLDQMALNACHALVQFNCREIPHAERIKWCQLNLSHNGVSAWDFQNDERIPRYYLDCQMYQRSADTFLGVPFNIASYALLTMILAQTCNMVAGDFIHTFGDVHIYDNHRDAITLQMSREERALPTIKISNNILNDLKNHGLLETLPHIVFEDFKLEGYDPHPYIKAELSTGLTNKK